MPENPDQRSLFARLARNTGSNGLFFVLEQGLWLVSYIVLIRVMGLEQFGTLILIGTLLGQFALLDGGLSAGLQRFIPEFRVEEDIAQIPRAIGVTLAVYGVVACVGAILFFLVPGLGVFRFLGIESGGGAREAFFAAGCLVLLYWPVQVFKSACRGFNLFHEANRIRFGANLVGEILTILSVISGAFLWQVVVVRFAAKIMAAIWEYRLLRRHIPRVIQLDGKAFQVGRRIFSFSGWVFLIRMSSKATNDLDKLWVSLIVGVQALPIYFGLVRIMKFPLQFNQILKSAVIPLASELGKTRSASEFSRVGAQGLVVFNLAFGLFSFAVILCAKPILVVVGGEQMLPHVLAVQLGCLFLMPVAGRAFYNQMLIGTGFRMPAQTVWSVVTGLVSVLVFIGFAKVFGLPGAVLANPATHLFMMIFWLLWIARYADLGIWGVLKGIGRGQWPVWLGSLSAMGLTQFGDMLVSGQIIASFAIAAAVLLFAWVGTLTSLERQRLSVYVKEGANLLRNRGYSP